MQMSSKYSIPDQPKVKNTKITNFNIILKQRFALAKEQNNKRVLDIDSFYKSDYLKGKNVLITGQHEF